MASSFTLALGSTVSPIPAEAEGQFSVDSFVQAPAPRCGGTSSWCVVQVFSCSASYTALSLSAVQPHPGLGSVIVVPLASLFYMLAAMLIFPFFYNKAAPHTIASFLRSWLQCC